ncbi:hypothetical protein BPNSA17_02630 [Bordetella petrii]
MFYWRRRRAAGRAGLHGAVRAPRAPGIATLASSGPSGPPYGVRSLGPEAPRPPRRPPATCNGRMASGAGQVGVLALRCYGGGGKEERLAGPRLQSALRGLQAHL